MDQCKLKLPVVYLHNTARRKWHNKQAGATSINGAVEKTKSMNSWIILPETMQYMKYYGGNEKDTF